MGLIEMEESSKKSVVQMGKSTEISPSLSTSWNPSTKRRRCRPDSSMVCYSLEKSNCLKALRYSESECYLITKEHSSTDFLDKNYLKHAMYEDQKGEIDIGSSEPRATSTKCDSFSTYLDDPESDEVSQPSGVVRKKMKQGLKACSFGRNNHNEKEITTMWFDVKLTGDGISREENVPFVCLTSKLDGMQILGYPVEIEESSVCPKKKTAACKLFNDDDEGNGFVKLVRETCRRTPVCYVNTKVYSQENGLSNAENGQSKKGSAPSLTCIPVAHIFSKIIAVVGQ